MAVLETDTLALAYDDDGPREGPVVLLLHGWPDDVSTWDDVRLALHGAGLRTVMPSLRGFGATRFLSPAAPRTGNSGIHALDMIALMDGLGVDRFMWRDTTGVRTSPRRWRSAGPAGSSA